MLLLVYVLVSLYLALLSLAYPVYVKVNELLAKQTVPNPSEIVFLSGFSINLLLTITITLFFKFHVKLVLFNSTTIEEMDKKNAQKPNIYNRGSRLNWHQVFGKNKLLWFLPVTGISGKPIGDGVTWTQDNNNLDEEIPENEVDSRKSVPGAGNQLPGDSGKFVPSPQPGTSSRHYESRQKEEVDSNTVTDSLRKNQNLRFK